MVPLNTSFLCDARVCVYLITFGMAIACVACVNGHDGDQYMRHSRIEVVIDKHDTSAEQKKKTRTADTI